MFTNAYHKIPRSSKPFAAHIAKTVKAIERSKLDVATEEVRREIEESLERDPDYAVPSRAMVHLRAKERLSTREADVEAQRQKNEAKLRDRVDEIYRAYETKADLGEVHEQPARLSDLAAEDWYRTRFTLEGVCSRLMADDECDVSHLDTEGKKAWQDAKRIFESAKQREHVPTQWVALIDQGETVPHGVSENWTERYRAGLARVGVVDDSAELVLELAPGDHPRLVIWLPEPWSWTQVQYWASRKLPEIETSDDYSEPRFRPLDEWQGWGRYVPARATETPDLSALRRSGAKAGDRPVVLSTGVPSLDACLPHGGLYAGRMLTIGASQGTGKTSLAYEIAETALAAGYLVLWWAIDETPEEIDGRRAQRHGSIEDAKESDQRHGGELYYPSSENLLDKVWLLRKAKDSQPLLIVGDSLQRVQSSGSLAHSMMHDALAALYADIERCQRKHPAIVVFTSEVTRDGELKGSTQIGHRSHIILKAERKGADLAITVEKARGPGGKETTVHVKLDGARQRIVDPNAPAPGTNVGSDAEQRIWEAIQAKLTERGPLSKQKLEETITGKGSLIRKVVATRLDAGDLTMTRGKLALP